MSVIPLIALMADMAPLMPMDRVADDRLPRGPKERVGSSERMLSRQEAYKKQSARGKPKSKSVKKSGIPGKFKAR